MCLLNVHLDLGNPSFLTSPLRPNTAATEQQTSQLSDLEAPVAPDWKQMLPTSSVLQTEGPCWNCPSCGGIASKSRCLSGLVNKTKGLNLGIFPLPE